MARTQTMVQLTDRLVRMLDKMAARKGISRSALIRDAIEQFLEKDEEALVGRRIIAGYERIPPAAPDEWGGLSEVTDSAADDLLHRLDAEERAAGHEPW
jgi:predicted DNA-binding protein